MSLDPIYKDAHKAFRKFLKEPKGLERMQINNIIDAIEHHLPNIIEKKIDITFGVIYDKQYDLNCLLLILDEFNEHTDWLAEPHVYISKEVLKYYIDFYAKENNINLSEFEARRQKKIERQRNSVEGGAFECHCVKYERDPKLRNACIEKYSCKCYVCGFAFEAVYGEAGKGFIEVHHLTPLSKTREEKAVSVDDLRPLCSNCHSMIHRKKPNGLRDPYSIDELKAFIRGE